MSKAVPRSTGHPTGMGKRRTAKPAPQSIDFDYFEGMGARVDREIAAVEDALIAYVEDQHKRDALYADQQKKETAALEARYPALRKEGLA